MEIQLKKKTIKANELTMQVLKSKKMNVAAYARVSTDLDNQRISLDSQKKYYNSKIIENPNWNLVDVYVDDGLSATGVGRRLGFQRMMRDVGRGKIDLILTKSVSRFARNTLDTLNYVRKLRKNGVGIYFEEENINTLDMNGELLLTILSSISQQESLNLSAHVNVAMKYKMEKGEPCGTVKCYGYDYNKKTKEMTIIPEQAEVIKMMANWYLGGDGTCKIARKLNDMKILPPCGKGIWREESVSRVLKNEKLKGDVLIGKFYTPNPLLHQRRPNKGIKDKFYVHDHHEPILSEELWQQIQDTMKERTEKRNFKARKSSQNRYSTSGIMMCGFCNNSLHRMMTNTMKDPKYYCSSNKATSNCECTESKMISEIVLQKVFMQTMKRLRNKIKLEHRFSNRINEKIKYIRSLLLNREDLDNDKYDEELFKNLVLFYVLGGYDENKKAQPYLLKIILKTENNEICEIYPKYKEYIKKELYTILDYYSNQTFHYYEKDKSGRIKQKYINRLRVQVQFELDDEDGIESN